jgi:ABC-type lipoprotein release transport system permease subunit
MAQVGDGFRRALGGDYELLPAIGRLPDVIRPSSRQMSLKRSTFVPNVTATALAAIALGVLGSFYPAWLATRQSPAAALGRA